MDGPKLARSIGVRPVHRQKNPTWMVCSSTLLPQACGPSVQKNRTATTHRVPLNDVETRAVPQSLWRHGTPVCQCSKMPRAAQVTIPALPP